jgi:hypothetical protein
MSRAAAGGDMWGFSPHPPCGVPKLASCLQIVDFSGGHRILAPHRLHNAPSSVVRAVYIAAGERTALRAAASVTMHARYAWRDRARRADAYGPRCSCCLHRRPASTVARAAGTGCSAMWSCLLRPALAARFSERSTTPLHVSPQPRVLLRGDSYRPDSGVAGPRARHPAGAGSERRYGVTSP